MRQLLPVYFICFLFFSNYIYAQDETEVSLEEYFEVSLEDVLNVGIVSATQQKQSVLDAPASAYVVTAQDIENRGYTDLVQLLEDIPEIEIQKNSSNEYKNVITVRGVVGNEKLLILKNGYRVSPALGEYYVLGNQFNVKDVERVEVIIGPASALYGADAFSGIINIVYPEKPDNGKQFTAKANLSYGNYNSTVNNLYVGKKFDKLYLTVHGHYAHSDGADIQNSYKNDLSWYHNQFIPNNNVYESPFFLQPYNAYYFQRNAGASFHGEDLSKDFYNGYSSYSFNTHLYSDKFEIGYSRMYEEHNSSIGLDPRFSIYDKNAFIGTTQDNVIGKYKFQSFDHRWSLTTTLNLNHYEIAPESNWVTSTSRYQRGYYYGFTNSSKVDEKFAYKFSDNTNLIVGASVEYISSMPTTSLSPTPFDPNLPPELQDYYYVGAAGYNPYESDPDNVHYVDSLAVQQTIYQVNYLNLAAYTQFQFKLLQTLATTIGVRYDNNSRYGNTINPRAGLVFEPINKLKWKILYGEAFLSPSPSKSFSQYGAFYGQGNDGSDLRADFFHVANPNLEPEKLRTLESSVNWFVVKNISLTLDGFYTNVDNIIDRFAEVENVDNIGQSIKATRLETSVNQGTSTTYGGTGSIKFLYQRNSVQSTIYGSYTYIDGDINGEQLPYQAKHTLKSGIDISHKKIGGSIRGIYRTESYSSTSIKGTDLTLQNSPYFVMNLNLYFYPFLTHSFKVFTTIENVTNQRYYNVYFGNEEGLTRTPQDPIRFLGGISYEF